MINSAELHTDELAQRAGVDIRLQESPDSIRDLMRLEAEVFTQDVDATLYSANDRIAQQHAGNYSYGAYQGNELVGMAMAFLGYHQGRVILHSHVIAVRSA